MTARKSTTVASKNFQSDFTLLNDGLIHLHQSRSINQRQEIQEAWGNIWSLAIADIPENLVSMRRGSSEVAVSGKVGIFLPPFAIVDWILTPGTINYNVVFSNRLLHEVAELAQSAFFFGYPSQKVPTSPEEVIEIVSASKNPVVIERGDTPHPMAAKLKHLIAATFEKDHTLGYLAAQIGTSAAFLARKFKDSYGLQPVTYRSQLRVHEAMRILLMESSSVTQAGYKGGFQDLSRFNKQFRKHLGAPPRSYKIEVPS